MSDAEIAAKVFEFLNNQLDDEHKVIWAMNVFGRCFALVLDRAREAQRDIPMERAEPPYIELDELIEGAFRVPRSCRM